MRPWIPVYSGASVIRTPIIRTFHLPDEFCWEQIYKCYLVPLGLIRNYIICFWTVSFHSKPSVYPDNCRLIDFQNDRAWILPPPPQGLNLPPYPHYTNTHSDAFVSCTSCCSMKRLSYCCLANQNFVLH